MGQKAVFTRLWALNFVKIRRFIGLKSRCRNAQILRFIISISILIFGSTSIAAPPFPVSNASLAPAVATCSKLGIGTSGYNFAYVFGGGVDLDNSGNGYVWTITPPITVDSTGSPGTVCPGSYYVEVSCTGIGQAQTGNCGGGSCAWNLRILNLKSKSDILTQSSPVNKQTGTSGTEGSGGGFQSHSHTIQTHGNVSDYNDWRGGIVFYEYGDWNTTWYPTGLGYINVRLEKGLSDPVGLHCNIKLVYIGAAA